eukprot:g1991.t1
MTNTGFEGYGKSALTPGMASHGAFSNTTNGLLPVSLLSSTTFTTIINLPPLRLQPRIEIISFLLQNYFSDQSSDQDVGYNNSIIDYVATRTHGFLPSDLMTLVTDVIITSETPIITSEPTHGTPRERTHDPSTQEISDVDINNSVNKRIPYFTKWSNSLSRMRPTILRGGANQADDSDIDLSMINEPNGMINEPNGMIRDPNSKTLLISSTTNTEPDLRDAQKDKKKKPVPHSSLFSLSTLPPSSLSSNSPSTSTSFASSLSLEDALRATANYEETWPKFSRDIVGLPPNLRKSLHEYVLDVNSPNEWPRGLLLHGPSGCGKTSLALAISRYLMEKGCEDDHSGVFCHQPKSSTSRNIPRTTATTTHGMRSRTHGVRCLPIQCTDLVDAEVGATEKNLTSLFRIARSLGNCVLILDGIEAIGRKRGFDGSENQSMDRLLSCLLIEMDGVNNIMTEANQTPLSLSKQKDKNPSQGYNEDFSPRILLIGTTEKREVLDPALLRSGRFGMHFYLGGPETISQQRAVLEYYLLKHCPDRTTLDSTWKKAIDRVLEHIRTQKKQSVLSFSDLQRIVNESAMRCVREYVAATTSGEQEEKALGSYNVTLYPRHLLAGVPKE